MFHFNQRLKLLFIIILSILSCNYDFTIGKWEDGIIPYYLKGEFSNQDILNIEEAMHNWENVCGVKFTKVSPRSSAYCIIRVTAYVWESSIGENNSQCRMLFGSSMSEVSIITHELGHCIGLVHEHQRPDRDLYVIINWANILSGKDYNFEIINNPLYIEEDFSYDYNSIMHYSPYAFSKNGNPTIESTDGSIIDPSEAITALDAEHAKAIYGEPFADGGDSE